MYGKECFILLLYPRKRSLEGTVKPALSGHSKEDQNWFQDPLSLNTGQKCCRMLRESNLQSFRPS